jgi:hypothetical protein
MKLIDRKLAKLIPLIVLTILLFGCKSKPTGFISDNILNWKYADLRAVDPSDAQQPDEDLIAVYTRFIGHSFQIRLDFLTLNEETGSELYLALDTQHGGTSRIETDHNGEIISDLEWDYLVKISGEDTFSIIDPQLLPVDSLMTFIVMDRAQDRMVISLPRDYLPVYPGLTKFQVFVADKNTGQVADEMNPVAVDAAPPQRASVLFAFWNTFPAASPAETLRSWAGAHSGPMSSRHGLSYLLDVADQTGATIFIMDAPTTKMLSAIDYIGEIPHLKAWIDHGTLGFVNSSNDTNNTEIITNWFKNDENNEFALYLLKNYIFNEFSRNFIGSGNGYAQFAKEINACDFDGLTNNTYRLGQIPIACKRLLLSYAASQSTYPLIIGGNFTTSLLGNPTVSKGLFTYIYAHPWIQILSISDVESAGEGNIVDSLIDQNSTQILKQQPNPSVVEVNILNSLEAAPQNLITMLAIQTYSLLKQPINPNALELSPEYIGQVGEMIAASEWAKEPTTIESCDSDLDDDGFDECILSNESIFMVIEPEGGYIPFVFSKDDNGPHQIIGPTWEFMLGISDQTSWKPDMGVRADMGQILGAFQDSFANWNSYETTVKPGEIELDNNGGSISKKIKLTANQISVTIQNHVGKQVNTYIPLVVDPWMRFFSNWGDLFQSSYSPFAYSWGIRSVEMINIQSDFQLEVNSFKDSEDSLQKEEDPNYDYPPGHYLPYPMSVIKISITDGSSFDIQLNP